MKIIGTFLFLISSFSISSMEPYYHSIKAHKGDGIYSILRRYHLVDHKCNKDEFLKLNELTIEDKLHIGKNYKLPIKIYEYNGKNIRSTIGIKDYNRALKIKEYNDRILNEKLRKTSYIDSKILWVPYHLNEFDLKDNNSNENASIADNSASKNKNNKINTEPNTASSTTIAKPKKGEIDEAKVKEAKVKEANVKYEKVPLFGKDLEKVMIVSDELKNEVYYIVSGHGGIDPGAMCTDCKTTLCEDEYAYDVSLRLARKLISNGATVHIVVQDKDDGIRSEKILKCDKDELINGKKIRGNHLYRLRHRAGAVNHQYMKHKKAGVKKQAAIMVHIDSNTDDKRIDAYFFHHKSSKSSKKLAEAMRTTFEKKYNYYQEGRGYTGSVKPSNLFMINNTYPTAVLVELANIKNKRDQTRILKERNRELLAEWMYEGIVSAEF